MHHIAHYRVGVVADSHRIGPTGMLPMVETVLRYLTMDEIDPFVENTDTANYKTPEEAENARDQYVLANSMVGLDTLAVVVGVNHANVVLAIDGESVPPPDDTDLPFLTDKALRG